MREFDIGYPNSQTPRVLLAGDLPPENLSSCYVRIWVKNLLI